MGKIANITFTGASGTEYRFKAYSTLDTEFKNIGAVYIFTKRIIKEGTGKHKRIYIGQTGELKDRIENHDKRDCLEKYGVNCICVHIDDNEASRLSKETDLIRQYDPLCNKQ